MGFGITGGGLYILGPDGQYSLAEKIDNCTVECEDLGELDYLPLSINNLTESFTFTTRAAKEGIMALLGLNKAIIGACPNKRVAWLATHSRKKRTRTKNLNRAIKLLED